MEAETEAEFDFSDHIRFRVINNNLFIIFNDRYVIISKECKGSLFHGVRKMDNSVKIQITTTYYALPRPIYIFLNLSEDNIFKFIDYIFKNIEEFNNRYIPALIKY